MDGKANGTQQEAQAQQQETGTQELQAPETGQAASQGVDASAYEAQIAEREMLASLNWRVRSPMRRKTPKRQRSSETS